MNSHEDLISSIKEAHMELVIYIDQIQPLLRAYFQVKPRVRDMHIKLLAHLGRQNEMMFDELRFFYADDRPSLKIVEFLVHDLKDIKIKYLIYMEQHSGELADINAKSFPLDFTHISNEILARIKMEEEYLIPLLEKLPP